MGRLIEEVVEDIKNGTWGSDIDYRSECEKLHELCDEILEIEKTKTEKIVAELEEAGNQRLEDAFGGREEMEALAYRQGTRKAIELVRKGGVE